MLAVSTLLAGGLAAATVPRKSPEFAIATPQGQQILLSSYHGKVVALMFILTTCPHCQHTTQIMSKMQAEYGPRGFQVLATAIEDMARMNLPGFVKQFNPGFPVGFNDRDSVLSYLQHPSMLRLMMPQLVFIDRQGTIRKQLSGDDPFFTRDQEKNIRNEIETLLKEGAATTTQKKAASHKKKA